MPGTIEQLTPRVEITPAGCWEWTGGRDRDGYGYGQFELSGEPSRQVRAHRAAWTLANGPIPPGLCVLHSCDNPPCCNPAHLFLGTQGDNMADMVAKGRGRPGRVPGELSGRAKVTEDQVREIRRRVTAGERQCDVRKVYGLSRGHISKIVARESWGHVL